MGKRKNELKKKNKKEKQEEKPHFVLQVHDGTLGSKTSIGKG